MARLRTICSGKLYHNKDRDRKEDVNFLQLPVTQRGLVSHHSHYIDHFISIIEIVASR